MSLGRTEALIRDSARWGGIYGGWLRRVRRCPSPFFDARPGLMPLSLLVVHAISLPEGVFGTGYPEALFQGRLDCRAHASFADLEGVEVSAHVLIDRAGALTQFVPFHGRAWHAGVSQWQGRERCNDFSIGIELEGCDEEPYADAQYAPLVALTRLLMRDFPGITGQRIVGHSDIAPGRKTDPGPHFDWARYRAGLASSQEFGH